MDTLAPWRVDLSRSGQLYDLDADPYEQTNHFADPTVQDRVSEMKSRIAGWQNSVEDTVQLPV